MCGIAGVIHRDGAGGIGQEMTAMLQALRHRGPDSTGFAIYGTPARGQYVLRFKVAEQEELAGGFRIHEEIARRRASVDEHLKSLGVGVIEVDEATEYAFRYLIAYDGDMKRLADYIEDVDGAEILSIGNALELIKDLGDAGTVSGQYKLGHFAGTHGIGHTRMATESDVDIRSAHPYWAYPYNDVAVVHNGQITNYWIMRRQLERRGQRFVSNCDSELLAVYTASNLEPAWRSLSSSRSRKSTASSRIWWQPRTSSAWPRTTWPRSPWCSTRPTIWWRSPPRRSPSAASCPTRSIHGIPTMGRSGYGGHDRAPERVP
ncbi:MAG: glutamine amidotransferase [Kiloniellaceae bacterium]